MLENIYQQWQCGNENYIERYMDFVRLFAKLMDYSVEESLSLLESEPWFRKPQ
jgi:hypothetical protein